MRRPRILPVSCLLAALAPAVAAPSCCTDPVDNTSYFCLGEMSVAEEVAMGDEYAPNIVAMYDGSYDDPATYEYLNGLILEMAGHSVRAGDFRWNFTILNSSTPNAFAVPGGYIYVTRGLLAAMETEGQFISVMGHELGHVEHRHTHRQMAKQTAGSIFVGILQSAENAFLGDGSGGGSSIVTSAGAFGAQLVLLSYDRGQELQADKRGVYYAATMGYDPMDGVKTFEYFQKLEEESGGEGFALLRTHPVNERRIEDIEEVVRTEYPELAERPESSFRPQKQGNRRFEDLTAAIREVQPVYEKYDAAMLELQKGLEKDDAGTIASALDAFRDCARRLPDEALFATAVGMTLHFQGKHQEARAALADAIRLDDRSGSTRLFQPHFYLGLTLLEMNRAGEAASELEIAADLFPMNPAIPFHLGEAYEALGRKQDAIAAYERVIQLEGDPNGPLSTEARKRIEVLS